MLPASGGKRTKGNKAKGNKTQTEQIAAQFREALTEVYLSGPSVVPGESAQQDFLTDVRAAVEKATTSWSAFVAALSVLRPQNVYHVYCTVQEDSNPGRKTMTLEVSGYPSRDVSAATVSGQTWLEVTRKAACIVAAYVLPRTDMSRRPPWLPWHGIKLSSNLFFNLHEARRLARASRLEESLHFFDESIAEDPLNPYIRIEKATVLDELGLWIDALATYVDVVTLESWYDRSVWRRYRRIVGDLVEGTPRVFSRSPNGRAALQLARYRMICSLAAGERLAEQWHRNTAEVRSQPDREPLARHREADRAIRRLRPLLTRYAILMLKGYGPPGGQSEARDSWKSQQEEILTRLDSDDPVVIRRLFQFAALEEGAAMERDYRWFRIRRWIKLPVSQAAIRVLPVWSAIQYRYVESIQALEQSFAQGSAIPSRFNKRASGDCKHAMQWLDRVDTALREKDDRSGSSSALGIDRIWPPLPAGVAELIQNAVGGDFRRSRGWHNHYNAACTFAVSMLTPQILEAAIQNRKASRDGKNCCSSGKEWCAHEAELAKLFHRHKLLVWRSINELARAVSAADSRFAAGQSVWLRRGDQDLDDLRVTEDYAIFMERYLPESRPVPHLPQNPTIITVSGHMIKLIEQYAALRGSFWHDYADGAPASVSDFLDEPTWWKLLREFCADYGDWRTRHRLISQAMRSPDGTEHFNPSLARARTDATQSRAEDVPVVWDDVTKDGGHARACGWLMAAAERKCYAQAVIEERNGRLKLLGKCLTEPKPIDKAFENALAASPLKTPGRRIAGELAATWEAVRKWFGDDASQRDGDDARQKICQLRQRASESFH
jgi:hypothetical protein